MGVGVGVGVGLGVGVVGVGVGGRIIVFFWANVRVSVFAHASCFVSKL